MHLINRTKQKNKIIRNNQALALLKGLRILMASKDASGSLSNRNIKIVFVLGGPGSGKGTQCEKIVKKFGFTHLSAGDLLRAECNSNSEYGEMIQNLMKEGKLVPSDIIVRLIKKAILESKNDKFLIDGFPRNEENRLAFYKIMKIEPEFLLFFDCPEKELEKRLLNRNQGRADDNIETIRKRFKVFIESTLPVVTYYDQIGKVKKVDASKSIEEVFEDVKNIFSSFQDKENEKGHDEIFIETTLTSLLKKLLHILCCLEISE